MTAKSIDDALLRTLAVEKRLPRPKLVFFTQLRFKRETKAPKEPSTEAVLAALASAVAAGTVVALAGGKYELGAETAAKAERERKKTLAERKKAALPPAPKERVYFPAVAADAFERACSAVTKRFEVFATTADSVSFRWRHAHGVGPDFRLERATPAEAKRVMRPGQRGAIARREPKLMSFLALAFDDLDAVLDETNGLIEAQHVITTATGGPMFLAWNKQLVTADGTEINFNTTF